MRVCPKLDWGSLNYYKVYHMGFSVNVLEGGDSCGAYFLGFWLHGSPTLVESDMNPRKRGLKFSLVFESAIFGGSVVELSQRKQNQQIESLTS